MLKSFVALKDFIEKIGESLRAPVFVPSALLVGVNFFTIYPLVKRIYSLDLFKIPSDAFSGNSYFYILLLLLIFSYSFNSLSEIIFDFFSKRHIFKNKPSKLGKLENDCIDYIKTRYNINHVALWPAFASVLQKKDYMSEVEREKSLVDLFLNLSLVLIIIGLELLIIITHLVVLNVYFRLSHSSISLSTTIIFIVSIVILMAITVSFLFYRIAYASASNYYDKIKSAYALYRDDLRECLKLREFKNFRDERYVWRCLSRFLDANQFKGIEDGLIGGIHFNYKRRFKQQVQLLRLMSI
ncbi:hypothetical protein JXJ21_15390 [candidate division KSB1 bacterium]|nr:hypothetical protein [candidate division KSB1 bacterium]